MNPEHPPVAPMTLGNMRAICFRRDGVLGARVGEVAVDDHVSEGTVLDVNYVFRKPKQEIGRAQA